MTHIANARLLTVYKVLNVDGGLLCLSRLPKLEGNPGEVHDGKRV